MIRRALIPVAGVAIATIALSLWMTARGDYCHVVLVTLDSSDPQPATPGDDVRGATPNMDRLARHGVVFDRVLGASMRSAPAHATLLTGLRPAGHGIRDDGGRLRPGVGTLAEVLANAGYRTGAFIGGTSLTRSHTSLDRGFARWDENGVGSVGRPNRRTVHAAIAWLWGEAHQRAPNFSWVQLHVLLAPDMAGADAQLGVLLDALHAHGYWDEALVVVVGVGAGAVSGASSPGGTGDAGTRTGIPLTIRFPGDAHGGTRIAGPAHQVDVLPTILDALGIAAPPGRAGRSLMPVIRGALAQPATPPPS